MAFNTYLKLKGQRSGEIQGPSTNNRHPHEWIVTSTSHEVTSPRDPQSGLPTGKRIHRPMVVTVAWGANAPIIWGVLSTNENLSKVTISFTSSERDREQDYYTITLTNANIADIIEVSSGNTPALQVTFTYQKIEASTGGASWEDDWESRV